MDIVSYHCTDHRCEGKVISEGLGWRCCIWLLFGSFLRAGRRRSHSLSSCQRPEGVRCAAMGDGFWSRPPAPNYVSPGIIKRQLLESDVNPPREPFNQGMVHYLPRGDTHVGLHAAKDTKTTGTSHDQHLQNVIPSFSSATVSNLGGAGLAVKAGDTPGAIGGVSDLHVEEPSGSMPHGLGIAFAGQGHADPVSWAGPPGAETQLPQEASETLFVEGLPRDCTESQVAHIFRHFEGFKEVRLVSKDPEHNTGGRLVLCFVDFVDATCAMAALNALQGSKVDANDPGSPFLRLQFARNQAPRSGPGTPPMR